jgi:hypothetical protein
MASICGLDSGASVAAACSASGSACSRAARSMVARRNTIISSLGHHCSHQWRRDLVVVNHRSAPVATTMKESTSSGAAQPCSGAMPWERTA